MRYQIKAQGLVDPSWSEWFSGMDLVVETGTDGKMVTTLTGPVVDQAALRGIVTRLWDLNLTLVSIARLEPDAERGA